MAGRDEILGIVRAKGPVLPVQIAKALETSILFASAMLSELVSAKILKISKVKIGGSPVYYLEEHKGRLQEFSKHLPQKEREAYALLKEKKVLRETSQEPSIRVALKNIKDYAWPLMVTVNNQKEIFWRWYLSTNDEAGDLIKSMLGLNSSGTSVSSSEKKVEEIKENINKTEIKVEVKKEGIKQEPVLSEEKKTDLLQPKIIEKLNPVIESLHKKIDAPGEKLEITPEITQNIKIESRPVQTHLTTSGIKEEKNNPFVEEMFAFFSENNINVINKEIVKKNEIDFIVELQSTVGMLRYYCKAKSKRLIGDGDLSTAYVQGELKKLPVLFVSTGEPTKKAKEMLDHEFKNMVFKKLGGV